jgi:2-aminoadipate transaminase
LHRPGPAAAGWAQDLRRSALEDMLVATARPDVISLALGLPCEDLFPTAEMGESVARVLASEPRALQYAPPLERLREFVAGLMETRGVRCGPDEVFLTAGAQQGMSLLTRLLLDPGATVVVEAACYPGFLQALAPLSPRIVAAPSGPERGLDVDALERMLASGLRPALLYAIPDGHNPLGVSLPAESRKRLVELARGHGFPIVEDDAYGRVSYDDDGAPALRALDPEWVFHLGSFSKTLAPALRTGWIVAPARFHRALGSLKESTDINTTTLGQRAVADFVARGLFEPHVATLRAEYRRRRDAMLEAIERELPEGSRWSVPRAGFFTWVELPGGADAMAVLRVALERERVAFVPGEAFAAGDAPPARSALRLNFSHGSPESIREGVARVARALGAVSAREATHG